MRQRRRWFLQSLSLLLSVGTAAATTTNPETVQEIRCDLISAANDSDWLVVGVWMGVNGCCCGFVFCLFFVF